MRRLFTAIAFAALLGRASCNQSKEGGPGATRPDSEKPTLGKTENTFTLSAPLLPTNIIQGETKKNVAISINRGTNFDADVALTFENIPTGLSIEPAAPTIKHGDSEVKLTIAAAEDAALGDFNVKVVGQPTKGAATDVEFKVTVTAK